jgi:hypothetical protein
MNISFFDEKPNLDELDFKLPLLENYKNIDINALKKEGENYLKIILKKEYDAKRAQERKIMTPTDLSKMNLKELQAKAASLNIELEHESGKGRGRGATKFKTI